MKRRNLKTDHKLSKKPMTNAMEKRWSVFYLFRIHGLDRMGLGEVAHD